MGAKAQLKGLACVGSSLGRTFANRSADSTMASCTFLSRMRTSSSRWRMTKDASNRGYMNSWLNAFVPSLCTDWDATDLRSEVLEYRKLGLRYLAALCIPAKVATLLR